MSSQTHNRRLAQDDRHVRQQPSAVAPGVYPPLNPWQRLTVGEALARHWLLILLTTIVGAAAGVALGVTRTPTYTSSAQLNAGRLDAQSQALPGYITTGLTLAQAYARVIDTAQIQDPVARDLHKSPDYVASHLSATFDSSNPVFTINATGPTAADAHALAVTATQEIQRYSHADSVPPDAASALARYEQENILANVLASQANELRARYGDSPTDSQKAQIDSISAKVSVAHVRASADQQIYTAAITNTAAGTAPTQSQTLSLTGRFSVGRGGFGREVWYSSG